MLFLQQKKNKKINNLRGSNSNSRNNQVDGSISIAIEHLNVNRNQPNSNIPHTQSVAINEKLASVGGLFGALSIIITGALLYGIFTAKSSDKWYYIVAVLVNIALLIFLMLAAILFDRMYLRKRYDIQRQLRPLELSPSSCDRLANNPRRHPLVLTRENLQPILPPKYPGQIKDARTPIDTPIRSKPVPTRSNNSTRNQSNKNLSSQPPNYFDLYPDQFHSTCIN